QKHNKQTSRRQDEQGKVYKSPLHSPLLESRIFSTTLNFALRDGGLSLASASVASTGFLVTSLARGFPPPPQRRASSRQMQLAANSRNKFFTTLSSSEWKLMTPRMPPGFSTRNAARIPRTARSSSPCTAIRSA